MSNVKLVTFGQNHGIEAITECLEKAKRQAIEKGYTKCMVILLNDTGDEYHTGLQTTMKASECLALVAVAKDNILGDMCHCTNPGS